MARLDLHTHSSVSDGTDAPAALVTAAAAARLDVVALTDHDTFDGLAAARAAADRRGIGFLAGMEMSSSQGGASVHLVTYGADPDDAALAAELDRIRAGRSGRVPAMVRKLTELGLPLSVDDVLAEAGSAPSVGRPHVADALVRRGHVADRAEAFDRWLGDDRPAYVERYTPDVARAITLVRAAGGVAVLAHPWGRGRRPDLPPHLIGALAEHGLDGVEVFHPDHDERTRAELGTLAARLGLLPFGSSDYHGAGKPDNPLGCATTDGEVYAEVLHRIRARGGRP